MPTGIDIRDHACQSLNASTVRRTDTTAPTFPGSVIRAKLAQKGTSGITGIWEAETGLDFNETFPPSGTQQGASLPKALTTPNAFNALNRARFGARKTAVGFLAAHGAERLAPRKSKILKPKTPAVKQPENVEHAEEAPAYPLTAFNTAEPLASVDVTAIVGKCQGCRLGGVDCIGGRPCNRCVSRFQECEE